MSLWFVRLVFLVFFLRPRLVASADSFSEFNPSFGRDDSSDYSVKIISQNGDQSPVIEGETIVLYCDVRSVGGSPPVNPSRLHYRWLFNGANLSPEPRKHSNNDQLLIQRTDYAADYGEYRCQVFFSDPPSRMLESAAYQLSNIHWISPTAKIVHFKYPDGQDDEDLPPQALPIEPLNQFKAPFRLALSCQAFGYPELQFDWFLNGDPIVAVNNRLSGSRYAVERNGAHLFINGQDATVNGVYTCLARNSVATRDSQNSFAIKVKQKRPTSLELRSISGDQVVSEGRPMVLNCEFVNYDRIQWYSPANSLITNSSRTLISANSTVLTIQQADKQSPHFGGLFRCIGFKADKKQTYSIRVHLAFIDEFPTPAILALYQQQNDGSNEIVVPENSKFELVCLPPNSRPPAEIYWTDPQQKTISATGPVRVLDNQRLLLQRAEPSISGSYQCVAKNSAGLRAKTFTIRVRGLPAFAGHDGSRQATERTAKEQTNVTLDCLESLKGNQLDSPNIQWYHNGRSVNDRRRTINSAGQLTIGQAIDLDSGLYVCSINQTGFPVTYSPKINHLKVIELLKFVQVPVDRRIELNRPAKVHCRARTSTDAASLQIRWIRGDFSAALRLLNAQSDQHLELDANRLKELNEWIAGRNQTINATDSSNVKEENGVLVIQKMDKSAENQYTCLAFTREELIYATIRLESVVLPRFGRRPPERLERTAADDLRLDCEAIAEVKQSTYLRWDKNNDVSLITNNTRIKTFENGTLLIRNLTELDEGTFGCMLGGSGGFIRAESYVTVRSPLDGPRINDLLGSVCIALGIVLLYIVIIVGLLIWFSRNKRAAAPPRTAPGTPV